MEKARANICYKQITNMYEVTVVTEEYEYVTSFIILFLDL